MQRHTKESLSWLTFDLLEVCPKVTHGIFLRHGGVSHDLYSSLNMGFNGDLKERVEENRRRACEALKIQNYASLKQIHGDRVIQVSGSSHNEGDALTTQVPYLGLMILHADCQAALFYDPINHALANVHCGWRGSVKNIYQKTVESMHNLYGSKPENLLVGISPSLGPLAAEFIHYKEELPTPFHTFQIKPFYFDFWTLSQWQLECCGILPHHIEIAQLCTLSNPVDCFSYRRQKACGHHATIAYLN